MSGPRPTSCEDLAAFIDAAPSPFHAVAVTAERLSAAGFQEQSEHAAWEPLPRSFVRRGGSLVAWVLPEEFGRTTPLRIIGAHTDSPNLRIKPKPDSRSAGIARLGVEVYGGALLNSWLDRDLGLSGRVAVVAGDGVEERLIKVDRPVLRVPQLAIHLDREVNTAGLVLDPQRHLAPIWAEGSEDPMMFTGWLADELGVEAHAIGGWDLMAHDVTPAAVIGADRRWLAAARIDNLASCHAATVALSEARPDVQHVSVLCLFDHEEVGSVSATGASGPLLARTVDRIHDFARGGDDAVSSEDRARSLAASVCISADGAHATHPNYPDRHEPEHRIAMNGGPVIKRNSNERYATDARGQAVATEACRRAGVPFQIFVTRSDLACGSTIGPLTAAKLGITTIDMGLAQLSMHSARELCGVDDPAMLTAALGAFLAGSPA